MNVPDCMLLHRPRSLALSESIAMVSGTKNTNQPDLGMSPQLSHRLTKSDGWSTREDQLAHTEIPREIFPKAKCVVTKKKYNNQ